MKPLPEQVSFDGWGRPTGCRICAKKLSTGHVGRSYVICRKKTCALRDRNRRIAQLKTMEGFRGHCSECSSPYGAPHRRLCSRVDEFNDAPEKP